MKSFFQFKQSLTEAAGKKVFDKKIKGVKVEVYNEGGRKFVLYIDGDELDDYKDLQSAKAAAVEFIEMNEEVELNEAKMEDSEVLSVAKRLAANGKDEKAKSFGQGLVDFYKKNGSFTPDQVSGLQNIMKNASFQLAKESVDLDEELSAKEEKDLLYTFMSLSYKDKEEVSKAYEKNPDHAVKLLQAIARKK